MNRRALFESLLFFMVAACVPRSGAVAPDGSESVLPEEDEAVPANKAWSRSFTLNYAAELELKYEVEPSKQIDIYFLTEEQDARASAGEEPTEQGRDFIAHHRGVIRSGNFINSAQPGRYVYVFRNLTDTDVRLKTSVLGRRADAK